MKGLTLSQKEQARIQVLNKVLEKRIEVGEAAVIMNLSKRQAWRILAGYRKKGVAAVVHGNRGREPVNAIRKEVKERVKELAEGRYERVNHSHLTELLAEREGISLCRSTVRRILGNAGMKSPREHRAPLHRSRRERYGQEGMLLQADGSSHAWLEKRGPSLTLVGAIDDATGTVPYALFRENEDTQGYFQLFERIIVRKGIPLALYTDRHSIFVSSAKESLEEQLAGERKPTQFGRALRELGIENIFALSPEAKGRIERLWETFQDRLVVVLRLAGVATIDEANRVLWDYLPKFNARFGVPAREEGSAYRKPDANLPLEGILCFKYERKVARDNTIRFDGQVIQLLPGSDRLSYAHAKVEVQERLDGSIVVRYQGRTIASREAPPSPVTLRARKAERWQPTCPGDVSLVVGVSTDGVGSVGCGIGAQVGGAAGCGSAHETIKSQQGDRRDSYRPLANHPWRKLSLTKSLNP